MGLEHVYLQLQHLQQQFIIRLSDSDTDSTQYDDSDNYEDF